MTKYHFVAVGVGILIGVAFAGKIRQLPVVGTVVSKIPS